jgi:ABC-type phosphate transport system substrate-binding protein
MTTGIFARCLCVVLLCGCGVGAAAEIVFIVNAKNPVASLTAEQVKNLYLGKAKAFADGSPANPVDQAKGSAGRNELYRNYVKKDDATLQAYWSRQIFSGNGEPPRSVENAAAVKAWVAKDPSAIGYIEASELDGSVKKVPVK